MKTKRPARNVPQAERIRAVKLASVAMKRKSVKLVFFLLQCTVHAQIFFAILLTNVVSCRKAKVKSRQDVQMHKVKQRKQKDFWGRKIENKLKQTVFHAVIHLISYVLDLFDGLPLFYLIPRLIGTPSFIMDGSTWQASYDLSTSIKQCIFSEVGFLYFFHFLHNILLKFVQSVVKFHT